MEKPVTLANAPRVMRDALKRLEYAGVCVPIEVVARFVADCVADRRDVAYVNKVVNRTIYTFSRKVERNA